MTSPRFINKVRLPQHEEAVRVSPFSNTRPDPRAKGTEQSTRIDSGSLGNVRTKGVDRLVTSSSGKATYPWQKVASRKRAPRVQAKTSLHGEDIKRATPSPSSKVHTGVARSDQDTIGHTMPPIRSIPTIKKPRHFGSTAEKVADSINSAARANER